MPTNAFLGELIGTALLILLGDGVVANVVLKGTKGHGGGWIVITFGWAMAVFVGVFVTAGISPGHLNPAVTVAMAAADKYAWSLVVPTIAAQFLGAFAGAFLVWLMHKGHFDITESVDAKLGVFCTGPALSGAASNMISEILGTAVLIYAALHISGPEGGLGSLDALPVAFVVLAVGLSLGGTTGYAINPARDLAPRLVHALVPIVGKGSSHWEYAWIPVLGPIAGGLLAVLLHRLAV